jgi:glycosyltransferase involved in cell wall biosynthesis
VLSSFPTGPRMPHGERTRVTDCLVMPVYNEEPTLAAVLDAVRRHYDGDMVLVDDGSTDATAAILAARDDVRVVTHTVNAGYGQSLIDGAHAALEAGASRMVTMDVDGQHEPAHIPQFLTALAEGVDIVSGSRYLPASGKLGSAPPDRADINRRITDSINEVTGWGLTDAFCGFKAYRLASLAGISLTERGYAMPLELWAKSWRRGLAVRELPVERIYFDHDRSFGEDLDDPAKRYAYYTRVWERALHEED